MTSEWRTTTLGELCVGNGGGIQTGPFGSQLHAEDYLPTGVPVVMPQDLGDNVITTDAIARIGEADAERLSRHRLRVGDIVYSRRGDVERRSLVREENAGWLCGTGCLRVRTGDGSVVDPAFLSYRLGAPDARGWIVSHAVGATMPNLNTAILGALPLSVPGVEQQRAIADVLGALDDKIAANGRLATTAEALALAIASEIEPSTALDHLVAVGRTTVDPASLDAPTVRHYSLPAFDAGRAPDVVAPGEIKSNKVQIERPAVLVSKLNPRIPRVWDVPQVGTVPSLASTEFVVLYPRLVTSTMLWALVAQPRFGTALESMVSGTSGSHQRVSPRELLAVEVADEMDIGVDRQLRVLAAGQRAEAARREIRSLVTLRDALLPALMSGRLHVREAREAVREAEVPRPH